ncbi:methyltransferase domain-containing protein [Pararoseomonas indoligenes]|uniref:Methyltransferase domain-containing protein n=1 Tax=Roseomonas indoligenes TaxID=2820811 RepID=A0A940N7Q0_9PROT|nr:methyltransferase domain-containing protein [Pararoseomonas indoligenes]MBP0495607.1 methyltransferase domain-containing protein [Pararoseomonas indoligenes]
MQRDAVPDPSDLQTLIPAVAARYAGASRFTREFVPSKLRRDPATAAVLGLARRAGGLGHVVDLGCGRGQLGILLLLGGGATRVTGLDLDLRKVAEAGAAAAGLPAAFSAADLVRTEVPGGDTVLMADVLYQLPGGTQVRVLEGMARAARRRVVMRLFDPDRGWRSAFGMAMERAGRAIRRDGAAVQPMPVPEVAALLGRAGFRCTVTPCWAGTPLPNVLLVAERG